MTTSRNPVVPGGTIDGCSTFVQVNPTEQSDRSQTKNEVVLTKTNQYTWIENKEHNIYKDDSNKLYVNMNGQWVVVTTEDIPVDMDNQSSDNILNDSATDTNCISTDIAAQLVQFMTAVSSKLVVLQKRQEMIMKHLTEGGMKDSNGCSKCFHCNPSILEASKNFSFDKIKDEEGLNEFEKKIEEDEKYKLDFLAFCQSIIGVERDKKEFLNCCLELSRSLFDKSFWTLTTWQGTSKSDVVKFKLSDHAVFLNFFKFIIRTTINFTPSDKEYALFFQGRTKNAKQGANSNQMRTLASRTRAPSASAPKARKPNNETVENAGDENLNAATSPQNLNETEGQ